MTVKKPEQDDLTLRSGTLPENIEAALKRTDDLPERATLIDDGVYYDTESARCLGTDEQQDGHEVVTYGLYRGKNGRLFRQRISRESELKPSTHDPSGLGAVLGGLFGIALVIVSTLFFQSLGFRAEALLPIGLGLFYASTLMGMGYRMLRSWTYKCLYALTGCEQPLNLVENELEPLSRTDLLTSPQSEPERRLARRLRNERPTWSGPSGTVVERSDGSYLYDQPDDAFVYSSREKLRIAIENQNDLELHRAVFGDYDEA